MNSITSSQAAKVYPNIVSEIENLPEKKDKSTLTKLFEEFAKFSQDESLIEDPLEKPNIIILHDSFQKIDQIFANNICGANDIKKYLHTLAEEAGLCNPLKITTANNFIASTETLKKEEIAQKVSAKLRNNIISEIIIADKLIAEDKYADTIQLINFVIRNFGQDLGYKVTDREYIAAQADPYAEALGENYLKELSSVLLPNEPFDLLRMKDVFKNNFKNLFYLDFTQKRLSEQALEIINEPKAVTLREGLGNYLADFADRLYPEKIAQEYDDDAVTYIISECIFRNFDNDLQYNERAVELLFHEQFKEIKERKDQLDEKFNTFKQLSEKTISPQDLPEKFREDYLVMVQACKVYPEAIALAPLHLQKELCLLYPSLAKHVDSSLFNSESFVKKLLGSDHRVYPFLPETWKETKQFIKAFRWNYKVFEYAKDRWKSGEMFVDAFKINPKILRIVASELTDVVTIKTLLEINTQITLKCILPENEFWQNVIPNKESFREHDYILAFNDYKKFLMKQIKGYEGESEKDFTFPQLFATAPQELRRDKKYLEELMDIDPATLQFADESLREDEELIKKYVVIDAKVYNFMADSKKKDLDFIHELFTINPKILNELYEDHQNNIELTNKLLLKNPKMFLEFLSSDEINPDIFEVITKDLEVITKDLKDVDLIKDIITYQMPLGLKCILPENEFWQNIIPNKEQLSEQEYLIAYEDYKLFLKDQIIGYGLGQDSVIFSELLATAPLELRKDKQFIIELMEHSMAHLEYADNSLREDEKLIKEYVTYDVTIYNYMADSKKKDVNFLQQLFAVNSDILLEILKDPDKIDLVKNLFLIQPKMCFDVIKDNPLFWDKINNDEKFILEVISGNSYKQEKYQNDSDELKNPAFFGAASLELQNNKNFIKKAVLITSDVLEYRTNTIEFEKEFIKELVSIDPSVVKFLKINDKEFIKELVEIDPLIVKFLDISLNEDKEFIKDLVKANVTVVKYLNKEIKKDVDFILELFNIDKKTISYIENKNTFIKLLKKNADAQNSFSNSEIQTYASKKLIRNLSISLTALHAQNHTSLTAIMKLFDPEFINKMSKINKNFKNIALNFKK